MNKKNSRKTLHRGMLIFYIACGLTLFLAFSLMMFRMSLNYKLNAKLDEIRAAGYPATLAELNNYYPAVPDDENAALLYEKAYSCYYDLDDKRFKQNSLKQVKVKEKYGKRRKQPKTFIDLVVIAGLAPNPILGKRLNEATRAASQQFVDANRDSIKILKQAAAMSKCRFPVDSNTERSADFKLRTLKRLLATATILAAENGNTKLAAENILAMLKICHALDYDPMQLSYLIKLRMLSRSIDVIEHTLSLIELNDSFLKQIEKGLESHIDKDSKLLNCVFAGTQIINMKFESAETIIDDKINYYIAKLIGIDIINKIKILEINTNIFTLNKHDIKAIKIYSDYEENQINILWRKRELYCFAVITMDFYTETIYKNLQIEAKIKEAIIGLAIERYRLKYHKLPVKLTQLVPEFIKKLPNDPFTQQPFRYIIGDIELQIPKGNHNIYKDNYQRQTSYDRQSVTCIKRPGWMIYSLGRDLKDDNGIVAKGYNYRAGDIPFKCVRK